MKQFICKPYRFACCFTVLLACLAGLTLLDAFVIPRVATAVDTSQDALTAAYLSAKGQTASQPSGGLLTDSLTDAVTAYDSAAAEEAQSDASSSTATQAGTDSSPMITATSYDDGSTSIQLSTHTLNGTTYYVADVHLQSAEKLITALAGGVYGRNIKAVTSEIAASADAILAINGDYYGFRDTGYVLRNGVIYRDISGGRDALVIDAAGNFSLVNESDVTLAELAAQGAWQVLSFGPGLVQDSSVIVDGNDEVSQSRSSNPRTAIGQVGENHYVLVVSDGRTRQSTGFSLMELAQAMQSLGCETAYNLDGGGSSTMVFMGRVINQPTSNGKTIQERSVSDIVAIGA